MGFLSKAWKGVKKGFKSIGKGIKSAFKKFGKFMGKIGILGQIAMMFIIPYVGGMLMNGLTSVGSAVVGQTAGQVAATAAGTAAGTTATAAATAAGATTTAAATAGATAASAATASTAATIAAGQAAGATAAQVAASTTAIGTSTATGLMSGGAIAQGAGQVLQAAGNFVKVGMNAFSTVTDGISSFIGEFGKTALNKIPGINIQSAATNFFTPSATGGSTAWGNVQANVMGNAAKTMASFNKAIGYTPPTVITAPPPPNLAAGTQGLDLTKMDVGEVANQGVIGTPAGTATSSVGPLKDGYGFPEVATAPSTVDPIKSFAENTKSLLAPSVSPVSGYGPLKANPQFSTTPLDPSSMPNVGPQPYERGFMEQATNSLGEVYRNAKTELSEGWDNFKANPVETLVGKDPVGKVFDTASGQFTGTLIQRGVMGKPEAPRTYVNQVAAFEPAAGMGEYGSPEINARAYEMTNNPTDFLANNVFGQPAGIVQQAYMRSMAKSGFGG